MVSFLASAAPASELDLSLVAPQPQAMGLCNQPNMQEAALEPLRIDRQPGTWPQRRAVGLAASVLTGYPHTGGLTS